jgi:voltage-gated potassium channel
MIAGDRDQEPRECFDPTAISEHIEAEAREGEPMATASPRYRRRYPMLRARNRLLLVLGPALWVAVLIMAGIVAVAVIALNVGERSNPNLTSLWAAPKWVVLALLTDRPWEPATATGRVVAFTVDLLKPVSIALITAAVTTQLFSSLVKRNSGMGRTRMKDHMVICGWSGKGSEILKEIRGRGDEASGRPVVVLASLDQNPTKDDLTTFVHGDPTEAKDLERAGIARARTAIVLADNSYPHIDVEEMDSRTLLTVLAIESLNPRCYTCVEVIHERNREHFARTKADELVVSSHVTGALLAHSAVTRGLAYVVEDLLTFPDGNEFYWLPVEGDLVGRTFTEGLLRLKQARDCIAIALAPHDGGYETNPAGNRVLRRGERLLVVAKVAPRPATGDFTVRVDAAQPISTGIAPASS